MLVVGGGPAGAAAAIYAARKGIRTGVVADRFGGQVLDTLAIENFISVAETEGPKLAAALEGTSAPTRSSVMKHPARHDDLSPRPTPDRGRAGERRAALGAQRRRRHRRALARHERAR
ncbi:MAG: FAD-dependent oxidoreductase [Parasphingorhabdus sp.]|nr:FAD-dependent oxidoreductase [Parasphingorhabdus sp.]